MWLLNVESRELESFEGNNIPPYAILSHRWEQDEVTFKDIAKKRNDGRKAFAKVDACCKQTAAAGLSYVWIDTCCIDKRSSAELSEAINSMYDWYAKSTICFAYLHDVKSPAEKTGHVDCLTVADNASTSDDDINVEVDIAKSVWFTRGWTLQELLAPPKVSFYGQDWIYIGNRDDYAAQIRQSTGIPEVALVAFDRNAWSILEKMSWAANRGTTRLEDRAYSLLGIFEVNMPLLYGEGNKAFKRLQEHIAASSRDISLFGWTESPAKHMQLTADHPQSYRNSYPVRWIGKSDSSISETISINQSGFTMFQSSKSQYVLTKEGLEGKLHLFHHVFNIYRLCIGHMFAGFDSDQDYLKIYFCIFLEKVGPSNVYRRVSFEGGNCIALATRAPRSKATDLRECKLLNLPIERVSATHFSSLQWYRFLGSDMTALLQREIIFVSPGCVTNTSSQRGTNASREEFFSDVLSFPHSSGNESLVPCLVLRIGSDTFTEGQGEIRLLITLYRDKWSGQVNVLFAYPLREDGRVEHPHQEELIKSGRHACSSLVERLPTALVSKLKFPLQGSRDIARQKSEAADGRSLPLTSGNPLFTIELGSSFRQVHEKPLTLILLQLEPLQHDKNSKVTQCLLDFNCYLPGLEAMPQMWTQFPGLSSNPPVSIRTQSTVPASYTWPARSVFAQYVR